MGHYFIIAMHAIPTCVLLYILEYTKAFNDDTAHYIMQPNKYEVTIKRY